MSDSSSRTSTPPRSPSPLRRITTLKHLGHQVINGRKVRLQAKGVTLAHGYIAGWDDPEVSGANAKFFVLQPHEDGFHRLLVPQTNTSVLLDDEEGYRSEKFYEGMEAVIGPFRAYVSRALLGRGDDRASDQASTQPRRTTS